MRVLLVVILAALVATVTACGAAATPAEVLQSPLASPTPPATVAARPATPTALPNPQPGKGTATGRFVDHTTGQPVADTVYYLGQLSAMKTDGQETDSQFIIMMPGSSPSAVTDQEGRLAFVDIEPNSYVVVFWTPMETWVLTNTETQKEIVVTIEPGKIADLGTVPIKTSR